MLAICPNTNMKVLEVIIDGSLNPIPYYLYSGCTNEDSDKSRLSVSNAAQNSARDQRQLEYSIWVRWT